MPSYRTPSRISFFYQDTRPSLSNRAGLKGFIEKLFRKEGKQLGTLSYIFCTDPALLAINRQFLQHDYFTDIITFELSPDKEVVQGEIYISVDRVRDNAREHQASFKEELHRVVFHGALHLCGYSDKSKRAQQIMREMENYYLDRYFSKA